MIVIYTNKDTVCVYNGEYISIDYSDRNTIKIYQNGNPIDEIDHSEILWRFSEESCDVFSKFVTQVKEAKETIPFIEDRVKVYGGMLEAVRKVKIGELVDQTGEYVLCCRHYVYDKVIFAIHKDDIDKITKDNLCARLVYVLEKDMEPKLNALINNYKTMYESAVDEAKSRSLIYKKRIAVLKHLKYNIGMTGLYEI